MGKRVVINVKEYVRGYVGLRTLEWVEKSLREYAGNNIRVVVDLTGLVVNPVYYKKLARLKYDYGCGYRGLGGKEGLVRFYIDTGYFIKESMGSEKYIEWFKRQVELVGDGLMVRDRRNEDTFGVGLQVIEPIGFKGRYFHFKVFKSHYLEPIRLEKAITEGECVYLWDTVWIEDIADGDIGLRFAVNLRERSMLDVYKGIVDGNLRGFYKGA